MAGDVEGQGNLDACHFGYCFQVVVDIVTSVAVSASFVSAGILDYGLQIVGGVFGLFVKNHLHFLCPFDNQLLSCLATAVGDVVYFEVGFFRKAMSIKLMPLK